MPDLDQWIQIHQLNEARNTYNCRSKLVVFRDEITPLLRDLDIFVGHMIKGMVQYTIKIPILQCHNEHSIARETSHSAGVSALLVVFRLHLGLLLAIVAAGC